MRFVACFTDRHGRRLKRSTGTTDRRQAQKIADEYEAAASRKRTALQVRRVITQLHREITGEEVSQTSLRNFVDEWLERMGTTACVKPTAPQASSPPFPDVEKSLAFVTVLLDVVKGLP